MAFERYDSVPRAPVLVPSVTLYGGRGARVNAAAKRRWGEVRRMRRVALFYCEDTSEVGFMPVTESRGLLVSEMGQFSVAGLFSEYEVEPPPHLTVVPLRRNGDGMYVFSVATNEVAVADVEGSEDAYTE